MPNIKSKEKNIKKIAKANEQNRATKSKVKTSIRKAKIAIQNKDENAPKLVQTAKKELDKAAAKNVIHQNNASRRASRLDAFAKRSTIEQAEPKKVAPRKTTSTTKTKSKKTATSTAKVVKA